MYEDRRVKKHHVQFESRDSREWWMGERSIILTIKLDRATSETPLNSVPFPLDGQSNRWKWRVSGQNSTIKEIDQSRKKTAFVYRQVLSRG